MTSEEGFQAAQNVYWWLPTDERSPTSVYLVCHPLQLCTGILGLLLLRLICHCRKIPACVMKWLSERMCFRASLFPMLSTREVVSQPELGRSTLNVLNYKYKYFPPQKYLSTSTFLFGEMYLSTFRVLSKCT